MAREDRYTRSLRDVAEQWFPGKYDEERLSGAKKAAALRSPFRLAAERAQRELLSMAKEERDYKRGIEMEKLRQSGRMSELDVSEKGAMARARLADFGATTRQTLSDVAAMNRVKKAEEGATRRHRETTGLERERFGENIRQFDLGEERASRLEDIAEENRNYERQRQEREDILKETPKYETSLIDELTGATRKETGYLFGEENTAPAYDTTGKSVQDIINDFSNMTTEQQIDAQKTLTPELARQINEERIRSAGIGMDQTQKTIQPGSPLQRGLSAWGQTQKWGTPYGLAWQAGKATRSGAKRLWDWARTAPGNR